MIKTLFSRSLSIGGVVEDAFIIAEFIDSFVGSQSIILVVWKRPF